MFILGGLINFCYFVLAQENKVDEIIARPTVEYRSGQLRDPFKTLIISEKQSGQEVAGTQQPKLDLTKFNVQGIIWGGKIPQAIINNQVLGINDLIVGAKILKIDQEGITLNFAGEIFELAAPGKKPIPKENLKED